MEHLANIVYPVIQNKENQELYYSLNSLKNLSNTGEVFLIGYKPKWVDEVIKVNHIPFPDAHRKGLNTSFKLHKACELLDEFIWFNDDMYLLDKIDKIPYFKLGSLKDYLDNMVIKTSNHYKSIKAVYDLYPEADCFDTHTPILYNSKKLLKIFDKYPIGTRGSKRSLYCIENNIRGETLIAPDYKEHKNDKIVDCKCYNDFKICKGQQFLSSADNMINDLDFVIFCDTIFTEFNKTEMRIKVIFKKPVHPYRSGEYASIKKEMAERLAKKDLLTIIDDDFKQNILNKSMENKPKKTKYDNTRTA